MNDGEMWTFMRSVLSRGAAISQGHLGGVKYPNYEAYQKKLDEVARESAEELALRVNNDSLRMALRAIMNYPEIRTYIGRELSDLADAAMKTPNAKSQATDAALSRQVACTDGLGIAPGEDAT